MIQVCGIKNDLVENRLLNNMSEAKRLIEIGKQKNCYLLRNCSSDEKSELQLFYVWKKE